MNEFKPGVVEIAEICARKHVKHFVLSPGSRSAPLTLAFLRHPELSCRMVVDERAAGFVALGLAQQLAEPVGLVCTSGTAALNYAPAVTEAFYQEVPLLVFTADRPPEWIDQNDGQTIHQHNLYGDHCRAFIDLPVDDSHPDARWQIQRSISEAINLTRWPVSGPVHINVPLREPLYPESKFVYPERHRVVSVAPVRTELAGETWNQLLEVWRRSKKRLIVAGLHRPDPELAHHLGSFAHLGAVLLADVTSNCHVPQEIHKFDAILGASPSVLQELAPDLLVTLGGPVVSKNLKLFLRKFKPQAHWQLQPHARCIDPFQSLTQIIPTSPAYFFSELSRRLSGDVEKAQVAESEAYVAGWQALASRAEKVLSTVLNEFPDCELSAMERILRHLPAGSNLQLGNSSIVRWANLLGFPDAQNCTVNSNRGTSGIDGTVSTAVGAALATARLTTLVATWLSSTTATACGKRTCRPTCAS